MELELSKYVERAFPKGECAVYCTSGKDAESGEEDIQLTAVIRNSRFRADNFWSVYRALKTSCLLFLDSATRCSRRYNLLLVANEYVYLRFQ